MPLRVIRDLLEHEDAEPERLRAMIELEDRILERALAGERERIRAEEVRSRYEVPEEVLDRLAELGVLTPDRRGFSPSDVRIVEAISRFRAGGYDERLGFTVYDTLRYKRALEQLVAEEVEVLTRRLAGDVDPDRAVELIEAGSGPLNDLIAALHTKLLVAELERHRGGPQGGRLSNGAPSTRAAFRVPALAVFAGALVAAGALILAAIAGPPYLSTDGVNGWIVLFAAALFCRPARGAVRARGSAAGGRPESDARWDRVVPLWGAIALAIGVAGVLAGAGGSFAGDSLAGSAGLVAAIESGLIVVALVFVLLSG